ncbi:cation:proton antiporter [Oscillospiraceae bacterium WX1]
MQTLFQSDYGTLLLLCVCAVLTPIISAKVKFIKIPTLVVEIIVGMVIGKSAFNLLGSPEVLGFMKTAGVLFFMLVLGLEINPDIIFRKPGQKGPNPLPIVIVVFFLSLGVSFAFGYILLLAGVVKSVYMVSVIIAATAPGIVIPILKENNMTETFYGQTLILYMTFSEIVCLFLVSSHSHMNLMGMVTNILLIAGIILSIMLFMAIKKRIGSSYQTALGDVKHFFNLDTRFVIALMFVYVFIIHVIGYDEVLGAYVLGITLAIVLGKKEKEVIHHKLDTISFGFFIPLFFIITGSGINVPALFSSTSIIMMIPILFAVMFAAKFIPAFLFKKIFSTKLTMQTGSMLAAQFSLLLIGSKIALEAKIIDDTFYSALVVTALLTSLILPVIFNKYITKNRDSKEIFAQMSDSQE